MPSIKAEITLRGLRVASCRRDPSLVGRVFPWERVVTESNGQGAQSRVLLPMGSEDARRYLFIITQLGSTDAKLAKRLRARAIRKKGSEGTLDLSVDPRHLRMLFVWTNATFVGLGVLSVAAGYLRIVHPKFGWPPFEDPTVESQYVDAVVSVVRMWALMIGTSIAAVSVPMIAILSNRIVGVNADRVAIKPLVGDPVSLDARDIERVSRLGWKRLRFELRNGTSRTGKASESIPIGALDALGYIAERDRLSENDPKKNAWIWMYAAILFGIAMVGYVAIVLVAKIPANKAIDLGWLFAATMLASLGLRWWSATFGTKKDDELPKL